MRSELNPRSFIMWRMRMKDRDTNHRAMRSPDMNYVDRDIADHRRENC